MTGSEALLLGIIQGLTEFLPVSSSGHLVIFQKLLGMATPPVAFDVLVHVATLVAVLVTFFPDLRRMGKSYLLAIAVGSVPAALLGIVLNQHTDQLFGSLTVVGLGLSLTTVIVGSTRWLGQGSRNQAEVNPKLAFLIGIAQAIAIVPGISRSGSTIATGLWLGLKREEAARFAFLLSIPAISGAQLLQVPSLLSNQSHEPWVLGTGFLAATVSGLVALRVLIKVVKHQSLHHFAWYTAALTAIVLFS